MLICRLDGSHRCVIACLVCLYVSVVCVYVCMKHLLSQPDSQMGSVLYLNIAVCRECVQQVLNAWLCMEYMSHVWCDYSLAACVIDDDSLLSASASFTTTEAFKGRMRMQCRSVCRCVVEYVHSNATRVCTVTPSQYSYIAKGVCFVKAPQCHKEHQTEMAFNTLLIKTAKVCGTSRMTFYIICLSAYAYYIYTRTIGIVQSCMLLCESSLPLLQVEDTCWLSETWLNCWYRGDVCSRSE